MRIGEIYTKHHEQGHRLGFSVLEKQRADWFLTQIKNHSSHKNFLDLGCRDATLTKHFLPFFEQILGVDVDPEALKKAERECPKAQFRTMDLLGDWSELGGKKFDIILCSEVLEHLYFPERVAEKIYEHLDPGGLFLGSVPNAFFLKHRLRYLFGERRFTPLEDPTHITQFNEGSLRFVLQRVGSKICIEGYTRAPLTWFARRFPSFSAFDFLFAVVRDEIIQ